MKTFEEIIKILQDNDVSLYDFAYNDVDFKEIGLGEVIVTDRYGGEGKGETWYSVKHFVDFDIYIKIDGWYSSYEGVSFESWGHDVKQVKPLQKTITVYE